MSHKDLSLQLLSRLTLSFSAVGSAACNAHLLPTMALRRYESEDRFFRGYESDVVPGDDDDDDDDEEDERESSVDLLIRFLTSMFKKVSKRAKKASRRVLPAAISPRLVSFAVDGILLLGSLSITRAFLEVICNLGGTVFTVILLIRLFWVGASFFQTYGNSFGPNPI